MEKLSSVTHVPAALVVAEVVQRTSRTEPPRAAPVAPAPAPAPTPSLSVASVVAAIMAQGAPIDLEKVARVRAQIARGTFAVDPVATADAMLKMGARNK